MGIFWLGGGVDKKGDISGELSIEEFVMGEDNFPKGRAGFSSNI